jgi:hypothetical protein
MDVTFPTTPADVTVPWLSQVIDAPVAAIQYENLGEGVGVMAEVSRLHVTYAEPVDRAPTFILKTASPAEANRDTATTYGFYRREVRFYQEVAHGLSLRVPRAWFSDMAESSVPFAILMEEIVGAQPMDQLVGCTVEEAEAVVDALALLHARWWNSPDLDQLDWLPPVNNDMYKGYAQVMPQLAPLLRSAWEDRLDPAGWPIVEAMESRYVNYLDWWMRSGHVTFCHYDVRPDNILLPAAGSGDALCLLDWQLAVRHTGTFDLAYFLGQNVSPEFRRTHQDRLLRRYHDAITGLGVTGYSFDRCWDDFRRGMLMHVVSATQLVVLDGGNDRGRQLLDNMLQAGWTSAIELDSASFLAELS